MFYSKRKISAIFMLLIIALLTVSLVACGRNDDDDENGENGYVTENGQPGDDTDPGGDDPPGNDPVTVVVEPEPEGFPPNPPAYGSVSLRVETIGGQQWDGVQVSTAALGLELGNTYTFYFEVFTPVAQGGVDVGLLMQTSSPWRHITPTRTFEAGEALQWHSYSGTLNFDGLAEVPAHIQIVKNGSGPNPNANVTFYIDNFVVTLDGEKIASFNFEDGRTGPFGDSGQAIISTGVAEVPIGVLLHDINFDDATMARYPTQLLSGAQVSMERVTNFGHSNNYSMRLTNTTGNYTSGAGNFFRFNPPSNLSEGSTYRISWWVYIPSDRNHDKTAIPGGGIVLNGAFGTPANQPTDALDLGSVTRMDEWVNITTEFELDHQVGNVNHILFRFRVNEPYRQPTVWYIADIQIHEVGVGEAITPEWDLTLPSIAAVWENYFLVGNIIEPPLITGNPWGVIEMFRHHYNSVTAENAMKPDAISGGAATTRPASLTLGGARQIVNFAERYGLDMVGHTLIWHSQSAPWLTNNLDGSPLTRAEAMENMRWFIEQYAGYFEGRIDAWDVTNEVFTNGGGANTIGASPEGSPIYESGTWQRALRNYAPWYHAFANGADFDAGERGYDYIYYAFVFTRRYAPTALLIYNDFNEEFPNKRNAIANMVEDLNERWHNDSVNNPAYGNPAHPDYGRLLIEVIGMQSHYGHNSNLGNVRLAMQRFSETGARIHITELDITFPTDTPFQLTEEQLHAQAYMYARLFALYLEFSDYIDRVTFWGREDGTSWRGARAPLHFDRFFRPKPAFWAIIDPIGWLEENR